MYAREKHSYQTQSGELHKWHSGARTPCLILLQVNTGNGSKEGKVRDQNIKTDCVYV